MPDTEALHRQVLLDHARERHGYDASVGTSGSRTPGTPAAGPALSGLASSGPALFGAIPSRPESSHPSAGPLVVHSRQVNPVCGDEVWVRAEVACDLRMTDVRWAGEGCSISQASASTLHDATRGLPLPQVQERITHFREVVRSRGALSPDEALLGDAAALAGVGRHLNRVKCAMLGWLALEDALTQINVTDHLPSEPVHVRPEPVEETR